MLISYNWLQDYLRITKNGEQVQLPAEEIAEILTNTGLEVEEVNEIGVSEDKLSDLVVGHVKEVEDHPNADKLKLTKVDIGTDELQQIICGAPNVAEGQKVVVAPVNTTIYPIEGNPFKIKKAKIRGIHSFGMICAEDEIGVGTDHEGIIVLPDSAGVGEPISKVLNVERDWVIDIAITPNRADAMSYLGVARDVAAYLTVNSDYEVEVKEPVLGELAMSGKLLPIDVSVEDEQLCPRYSGILFSNLEIKPSPEWLQTNLRNIGVKPINNVVDITNFILHELGQPLHAFDYEKIKGKEVVVKTLAEKTPFLTLDNEERKLSAEDLMICDAEGGMCIGGVYGGLGTGVSENTNTIFLESAFFDPVSIRRTALRHNLRTDAAMHFEKGTDPNVTVKALQRAAVLLKEYANADIASELIDIYPNEVKPVEFDVKYDYLETLSGQDIPKEDVVKILEALGIEILSNDQEKLKVKVPTVKNEVTRPADIAEEILRIYGYNNIEMPGFIKSFVSLQEDESHFKAEERLGDYLASIGFHEAVTLSLENSKHQLTEELVDMVNPISADLDIMRADLLPSTLKMVAYNHHRRNLNLKKFEIGRTYHETKDGYHERTGLALAMSGLAKPESWEQQDKPVSFFDMKAVVNGLLSRAGAEGWTAKPSEDKRFAYALDYLIGGRPLVTFGLVSSEIEKKFDLEKPVFYADVDWDELATLSENQIPEFSAIPKYPSTRRDLAMIIDKGVSYKQLEQIAVETCGDILEEVNLFDIYEDKKIGEGNSSYAMSFVFRDPNKTLKDQQVDQIMNKLVKRLEKEVNASIRK